VENPITKGVLTIVVKPATAGYASNSRYAIKRKASNSKDNKNVGNICNRRDGGKSRKNYSTSRAEKQQKRVLKHQETPTKAGSPKYVNVTLRYSLHNTVSM
jgi:hypothetical protein